MSSYRSLLSHWTSQQANILISAAGNAKIYLKNYNSYIIPRLTLLIETFIQTYNHSYTVHFFKSIKTILSLPWKLFLWLLGHFLFLLGHFLFLLGPFFSFLWGPFFISNLLSSIRGSPPHRHNWVDLRTHLPGCASHQVCSTYVSTPRVNLLVPVQVPAATYNTCSAHN